MESWNWVFVAFGVMLVVAATFAFGDPTLSPAAQAQAEATDFQVLLGMGGLAAVIAAIIMK